MKTTIIFISSALTFLFSSSVSAQTQFTYPMKPGDVHVYEWLDTPQWEPSYSGTTLSRIFKTVPLEGSTVNKNDTVYVCQFESNHFNDAYSIFVHDRKIVTKLCTDSTWDEMFPLITYDRDTSIFLRRSFNMGDGIFKIDSFATEISKTFTTNIFNTTVQAYWIRYEAPRRHIYTIADTFGIVLDNSYYDFGKCQSKLVSASINGIEYDRKYIRGNFSPLCSSNLYQYKRKMYSPDKDSFFTVHMIDTLIGLNKYFILKGFSMPLGWSNLLRNDSTGLYAYINGKDSLVLPSTVSLGTLSGRGMITDIKDTLIHGIMKKKIIVQQYSNNVYDYLSWIESIGPAFHWRTEQGQVFLDTLMYANVCGNEFGKLVSVEKLLLIVSPILSQNFPNPFSNTTTIAYRLLTIGHVRLEVFDMLGRRVAILVDEEKDAGEYSSNFNILNSSAAGGFDIHPGVYFYRLTVGDKTRCLRAIVYR